MTTYVLRRLLLAIPTLVTVSLVVFFAVRLIPGSAVDAVLSDSGATKEQAAALRKELGLEGPIWRQYLKWTGGVLHGDLGKSIYDQKSVSKLMSDRLPVTFELALLALVLSAVVGGVFGVAAAMRQDSWLDYVLRTVSITGLSIPGFWLATIVLVVAARWFHWSPPLSYIPFWKSPRTNLGQFLLPAALMALASSAQVMRLTRGMMLEVLRQDYVRTGRAKGLTERTVILRHTLRNAVLPVTAMLGVMAATLIGGTVVFESIFALPGIGQLVLEAVGRRDYPILQGVNIVLAAAVIAINLGVDLSFGVLDPRIRVARG